MTDNNAETNSEEGNEETVQLPQEQEDTILNEKFINELIVHVRSAVPALVVDVHDRRQFVKDIKEAVSRPTIDGSIVYWDGDEGLHYFPNNGTNARSLGTGDTTHPVEALRVIQEMVMEGKTPADCPQLNQKCVFLMRNFNECWSGMAWGPGRPYSVMEMIINCLPFFEHRTCSFIFYGPSMTVPETLSDDVQRLHYTLPGKEALGKAFDVIHNSARRGRPNLDLPTDETVEKSISATQGLYTHKARQAFTLALVRSDFSYNDPSYVAECARLRREYIRETGLVELVKPRGGFEVIGGYEDAKSMITRDLNGLNEEAQDFGMDKPNGILFGGPPGTGKSALAVATGGEFGMDVLLVSANKILHSHLGKSEENLNKILALPELYQGAGCILYFEECDKLFGSFSSKGDDSTMGTGLRLLGTLLTYFQERQYNKNDNAYIVGTFNNGAMLDDALLRPGRFNSKAWLGLPEDEARAAIFAVHLKKRKRELHNFPISELVDSTRGFTGAEIEHVVVETIKRAYAEKIEDEGSLAVGIAKLHNPQSTRENSEYDRQTRWAQESGFMDQCVNHTVASDERGILDSAPNMIMIGDEKINKKKKENDN